MHGDYKYIRKQRVQYYEDQILLDNDSISSLCLRTIKQSEAAEWFKARWVRITASVKVHKIRTMIRASAESLLENFLNKEILCIESSNYGVKNDQKARDCYKMKHHVHDIWNRIIRVTKTVLVRSFSWWNCSQWWRDNKNSWNKMFNIM